MWLAAGEPGQEMMMTRTRPHRDRDIFFTCSFLTWSDTNVNEGLLELEGLFRLLLLQLFLVSVLVDGRKKTGWKKDLQKKLSSWQCGRSAPSRRLARA